MKSTVAWQDRYQVPVFQMLLSTFFLLFCNLFHSYLFCLKKCSVNKIFKAVCKLLQPMSEPKVANTVNFCTFLSSI